MTFFTFNYKLKGMKKTACILLTFILLTVPLFPAFSKGKSSKKTDKSASKTEAEAIPEAPAIPQQPDLLEIFISSYPDLAFTCSWQEEKNDYLISIKKENGTSADFYWSSGSFLPEAETLNAEKYWTLLYEYPKVLADPADFTEEEKQALKKFGSSDNRRNGAGTPMFFFDFLYDSDTKAHLEKELCYTTFLGKPICIHSRIKEPLKRVEQRINEISKTDEKTRKFVAGLKSTEAYYWREIAGTGRKSFHSLGIAVDLIPNYYGGEAFWSWAKDHNPENWMLTPLSRRWLPPETVTRAFEAEGFIWGGKWAIWDNMHYEYHPELIKFNNITE